MGWVNLLLVVTIVLPTSYIALVHVLFLCTKCSAPLRRQIGACRIAQLLDLALHRLVQALRFVAKFLNALVVRPESPTVVLLEPVPIPQHFPVVGEVAEDRQTVLGLATVPPDLACAVAGLVRLICSQAIFVPAATSTDRLGLRGDRALIVLIRPAEMHKCGSLAQQLPSGPGS